MLQTLKEALSKTIVQASLVSIIFIGGLFYARRAQLSYEKALKDDALAQAYQQAADSIKKINDSLTVITKLDQARADSMLTIVRPRVIEHGQKVIHSVQVAIAAAKDSGVISVVIDPKTGLPDSLVTVPLPVFTYVLHTADSLVAAYAELKFTDDSTITDLKAVNTDLRNINVNSEAIIANKDTALKLRTDEIKELKKARKADKIKSGAIVVGAAVLYFFLHR